MNKAFEKIIEKLKEDEKHTFDGCINKRFAIEIVKQEAEQTNADRIRAMSDEELADFMYAKDIPWCNDSECPTETLCKDCFRKWLQSEVE